MRLRDWLAERQQNALRIAASKSGADRDGWLEDADYFGRAVKAAEGAQKQTAVVRALTNDELAECCGGFRSNSAIETWMRRAVAKFCDVNGIALAAGVDQETPTP